jgi:hypothetical protein
MNQNKNSELKKPNSLFLHNIRITILNRIRLINELENKGEIREETAKELRYSLEIALKNIEDGKPIAVMNVIASYVRKLYMMLILCNITHKQYIKLMIFPNNLYQANNNRNWCIVDNNRRQ